MTSRAMTGRRWAWLGVEMLAGLYGAALVAFTPSNVAMVIPSAIYAVGAALILGAALAVAGLVMGGQDSAAGVLGLTVELAGLVLVGGGFVAYLITQIALAGTLPNGVERIAFCVLLMFAVAAIVARVVVVWPRRSREAHDMSKTIT